MNRSGIDVSAEENPKNSRNNANPSRRLGTARGNERTDPPTPFPASQGTTAGRQGADFGTGDDLVDPDGSRL